MTDVHTRERRSYNMSRIKGKDTKPELVVRKFLFSQGIRYKLHDKKLPGRPDIVFPKYKTVLFVNGCFWHGHTGCKYFVVPKTKTEWWLDKINKTVSNDVVVTERLQQLGWNVLVVWECDLKKDRRPGCLMDILIRIKERKK
ncbi:very short patch repair endonuclease [Chitinophaga arvensicola]|uniref:Very short patch repair endonuclease n=1 Tax=Chitinophaga arvensicola TaxID=29529 RepID=A0A1I0SAC9_9BACT|nr:very short patch repair endonuclease [Chitinophaga arvensicola]SEW53501.1 T/G mismatch-specific endonuclease [Chitinophaga arvensicola]